MNIKFHSKIFQNNDTQEFEFKAPCEYEKYEEFDAFSFSEPNMGVRNRIELSKEKINIFAGGTTLFLNLNKDIASEYTLTEPNGKIATVEFLTHMEDYKFKPMKKYEFSYELYQQVSKKEKKIIGNYHITLEIN